jgi:hypothetical protein
MTAGAQIQVPEQTLTRGGVISGRVYDASTNAAIPGKTVGVSAFSCRVTFTTTDYDGRYAAAGLPFAPHRLLESESGSWHGGQSHAGNTTPVTVTSAVTVPNIDFSIAQRKKRILYVKYQLPNGNPVANMSGALQQLNGWQISGSGSSVSAAGVQFFSDIPMSEAGPVKLRVFASATHPAEYYNGKATFDAADPITLTGATTFVTMTLSGSTGVAVTGFFVDQDTGEPLSPRIDSASGAVLSDVGGYVTDADYSFVSSLQFDASGQFVSGLLRPGAYRFVAFTSGPQARHASREITVTVGGVPVSTTIPLQSGGVISGRITISGTNHEVESMEITLLDVNDQPVSGPAFYGVFNLPVDGGTYRFGVLPPGVYRLRFEERQLAMMPDCRITSVLPRTYFERTVPRGVLSAAQASRDIVVRAGEVVTANMAVPIAPFVPTPLPSATPAGVRPTATPAARDTRLFLPLTRR